MASPRRNLAQRRRAVGLSQEGLAEQLGVDRSTVGRWETGQTEPVPWVRPLLAIALSITADEVDQLLAPSAPDEQLAYAIDHPRSVDLVAVAQMREQIEKLDVSYDQKPSTALLPAVGQRLGEVTSLRTHATRTRVRRELLAVEAEAALLMGQLVWDASQRRDHPNARTYFAHARWAAQQVGNPVMEGLALLRTSFVALYGDGDPRTGLELASQAAEVAQQSSHVVTGLGILHASEAHAMGGRRQECERGLRLAEIEFDRIGTNDAAFDAYSPTQHGRLAGSCYLYLDDAKRAQPILESTAAALRGRSKSQAIVQANLALALLRQRRVDEATAALHRAIDIVSTTRGGGGLNLIFEAGLELRPWRQVPEVQDVHDRLLELMAS